MAAKRRRLEPIDVVVSPAADIVVSVRLTKDMTNGLLDEARLRAVPLSAIVREAVAEHQRGVWTRNGVNIVWVTA